MDQSISPRYIPITSWLPFLLWMIFIFVLSHMDGDSSQALTDVVKKIIYSVLDLFRKRGPDTEGGNTGFWFRKIAHILEYATLWILCWRFFRFRTGIRQAATVALFFCLAFACLDEVHQYFIPGRDGKILDVGVDMIGISYCFFIARILMKKYEV